VIDRKKKSKKREHGHGTLFITARREVGTDDRYGNAELSRTVVELRYRCWVMDQTTGRSELRDSIN
jgi:hypothetical protein